MDYIYPIRHIDEANVIVSIHFETYYIGVVIWIRTLPENPGPQLLGYFLKLCYCKPRLLKKKRKKKGNSWQVII